MNNPLVDQLAQPLVDLRELLGQPVDTARTVTALRTASAATVSAADASRRVPADLGEAWQGPAAEAAVHRISTVPSAASSIAHRGTTMADVLESAAADLGISQQQLNRIIDSFHDLAVQLGPVLRTPPGHTNVIDAARDHLSRALAVISGLRTKLDAHGTKLRALAPPPGETPKPVDAPSARPADAPAPAGPPNAATPAAPAAGYLGNGLFPGASPFGVGGYPYGMFAAPLSQIVGELGEVTSAAIGAGTHGVERLIPELTHHSDADTHRTGDEPDPIHAGSTPPPSDAPIGSTGPQPSHDTRGEHKGKGAKNGKNKDTSTPKDNTDGKAPATAGPGRPTPPGPTAPTAPPHPGGQAGVTTPLPPIGRAMDRTDRVPTKNDAAPSHDHTGGQAGVTVAAAFR